LTDIAEPTSVDPAMRVRGALLSLLVGALILAGAAGGQRTSTHIDYWWSGSAF